MSRVEGPRYGVPEVVEHNIRKQATKTALKAGRPDIVDDLEQEARIRAWQESRSGESDPRHLLADTQQAISGVMRSGTDVDGRLWPSYERRHVWEILSTDHPVDEKATPFGEIILDDTASVEEQVVGEIVIDEITRHLTDEERDIVSQRLEGFWHHEIAENLRLKDRYAVRRRMQRIREKLARCSKSYNATRGG